MQLTPYVTTPELQHKLAAAVSASSSWKMDRREATKQNCRDRPAFTSLKIPFYEMHRN